jgi:hypothetical protein
MRLPATVKWIGLALLGLLIAAAVAIAAGNLAGQQIGISSESLTAGDQLAPAVGRSGGDQRPSKGGSTSTTPPPATTEATVPPETNPTQPSEPPPAAESPDDSEGGAAVHGAGSDD